MRNWQVSVVMRVKIKAVVLPDADSNQAVGTAAQPLAARRRRVDLGTLAGRLFQAGRADYFARADFTTQEMNPWHEDGQVWRTLLVINGIGTAMGLTHTSKSAPLGLASTSPHAGLVAGQSPFQARDADRANCAYLFGPADLNQRRTGVPDWEEQVGIDMATCCVIMPVHASAPG